jgi:hypothetical protein
MKNINKKQLVIIIVALILGAGVFQLVSMAMVGLLKP